MRVLFVVVRLGRHDHAKKDPFLASVVDDVGASVRIARKTREFGRGASVCPTNRVALAARQKDFGRVVELHLAQTASEAVSHVARGGVCSRRAMGNGFGECVHPEEMEQGIPFYSDGGGRAVQVRLGGAVEKQDGAKRHRGVSPHFERQQRASTHAVANGFGQRIL